MNCSHARRLFGAYWDDEITQAEREWLESHFNACTRCHGEYDEHARALELLGALPRIEAPPELAERVLSRARRMQTAPDRVEAGGVRWVPATAAAAVVLVLAATLVWPWLVTGPRDSRDSRPVAVQAVPEPVLVERPASSAPPAPGARGGVPPSQATDRVLATITDSLFDHSEDVEFILDPVTLRRGRPTVARPTPTVQGQQATITF
jgi:anti-sigma factor RsiW